MFLRTTMEVVLKLLGVSQFEEHLVKISFLNLTPGTLDETPLEEGSRHPHFPETPCIITMNWVCRAPLRNTTCRLGEVISITVKIAKFK